MSNHLIIGLGGTGGKVIRNIRKAIYRDWRAPVAASANGGRKTAPPSSTDKVAAATPPGVRIDYLYMDSSREHMGFDDVEWKVLGENLQLDQGSQVELSGTNLGSIFEDIDAHKNIAPWLGPKKDWDAVLNIGGGGAKILGGQKRRLGRLLFALHSADFMAKVTQKVRSLQEGSTTDKVHFHIVCGLAGGTGSGTLVDVVAMIRNKFDRSETCPVMLYLVLPEDLPHAGWDTGNYHANGYAALTELNALAVGKYHPYNLAGDGDRLNKLKDPFKICYLISNENSQGRPFDVDRQVPELLAEVIYQVTIADTSGMSRQLEKIVEAENLMVEHEGGDGQAERCWMFASFGIKKISYPEDEIRDYIGYAFAGETLRKLLYNNWAQGYQNEPAPNSVQGFVADDQVRSQLDLDWPVFFLERRFSFEEVDKDQETWKPFEAGWKSFIDKVSVDAQESEGNWIDYLKIKCAEHEQAQFRSGRGVDAYFAWKTDLIPQYARAVARTVDERLTGDLFAGKRSLTEIEGILRALCEVLEKNVAEWAKLIEQLSTEAARQLWISKENLQRFADLGALARLVPGNKDRIFEAGRDALFAHHTNNTYVQGWPFAEKFLMQVNAELGRLANRVARASASFKSAEAKCAEHAQNHKPEENSREGSDVVLRLYNGDEVARYVKLLVGSQKAQDMQSREATDRMLHELMQGRESLNNLPIDQTQDLLDVLARAAHDTLSKFDARGADREDHERDDLPEIEKLLNVSIIDKLEERYSGNAEEMRREIREYMGRAACMLQFNTAEKAKAGPGFRFVDESNKLVERLVIMMPEADSEREFVGEMKQIFKQANPNARAEPLFIDTARKRPHEITIMNFVQLFPLRYLSLLSRLRDKYERRIQNAGQAFVLQTEGILSDYPPLFVRPLEQLVGPQLLLALVLGSVRPKSQPGGHPGTLRDLLVAVDPDDVACSDLGTGFSGSIGKAGEHLPVIRSENLRRAALRLGEESAVETVLVAAKKIGREIAAGDDDELRKLIEVAKQSKDEFEKLLQVARGKTSTNTDRA